MSKPKRPSNRDAAKAASREALIDAAVALIPKRGLDVSFDDLCAHAGYTRGAFYQHFKDRDALLAAILEREGPRVVDSLMGGVKSVLGSGDLGEIAQRATSALSEKSYPIGKHGFIRSHQLLEACARSPTIRRQYLALLRQATERVGTVATHAQKAGLLRQDLDPTAVAEMAVALFIGLRELSELELPIPSAGLLTAWMTMLQKR